MMSLATGEDVGTTNETGPIITEAKQSCASLTIQSVGGGGDALHHLRIGTTKKIRCIKMNEASFEKKTCQDKRIRA